jgi:hypothetical protein
MEKVKRTQEITKCGCVYGNIYDTQTPAYTKIHTYTLKYIYETQKLEYKDRHIQYTNTDTYRHRHIDRSYVT